MPDHLRDRLQSSLGAPYTLKRELGGGGMARGVSMFTPSSVRAERFVLLPGVETNLFVQPIMPIPSGL